MSLIKQRKFIHGEDWDILIILDACRYDVFEKVHGTYLDGELKKVRSEGSETREWLKKTWVDKYDLSYYSANPYVNSLGVWSLKVIQLPTIL